MSSEPADAADFQPPWWLQSGHAQTLWAGLVRSEPDRPLSRETVTLPDGDDLWLFHGPEADGPVVLVLHGLGGCVSSPYVLGLVEALRQAGFQGAVMQFRGAGNHINRLPRLFHAGAIEDLQATIDHLRALWPRRPLALVGFSMGGILILNWLGARGAAAPVDAAITVGAPLDLERSVSYMGSGVRRMYDRYLTRILVRQLRRKAAAQTLPLAAGALAGVTGLRAFDERVTAPLHGFRDAADYYRRCAPLNTLSQICVPTRMIHARDDPFVPPDSLPGPQSLPKPVHLAMQPGGGHVGYVGGSAPWRAHYWLDTALPGVITSMLGTAGATTATQTKRPPKGGLDEPAPRGDEPRET
ncbi:MAG: alpha/beta fold hydrolase [Ectothiorhodospiraceae bacterium]